MLHNVREMHDFKNVWTLIGKLFLKMHQINPVLAVVKTCFVFRKNLQAQYFLVLCYDCLGRWSQ